MAVAFCPGPSCQRVQPVDVDMDGVRHCAVCRKSLGPVPPERTEVAVAIPEDVSPRVAALEVLVAELAGRLARLERPTPLVRAVKRKGRR